MCGGQYLGGAGWGPAFSIVCIEEELGTEVACWWSVGDALRMGDEAAMFAQHGTLLHTLKAYSTYHR